MSGSPHGDVVLSVCPVAGPERDAALRPQLTRAELAYCLGLQRVAEHMTARVAGKRAVLDLLGLPDDMCLDVEIHRVPRTAPTVRLSGEAERARDAGGLPVPGVSLSHAAGHAAALAWLPG